MFNHIVAANIPVDAVRSLLNQEILERAEIAYEYSINPPTLVEWERYADWSRIKVELFVLESLLSLYMEA